MADRWYLVRGKEDPWVGIFESRRAALAWQEEHPNLIDWKPWRSERGEADGEGGHAPYCAACGESWPCQQHQDEKRMAFELWRVEQTCVHCGHIVQNGHMKIRVEGFGLFHGRKGPCRRAAERLSDRASLEVEDGRDVAR